MPLTARLALAFDCLVADEPAGLALRWLAAVLVPEPVPLPLVTAHANRLLPVWPRSRGIRSRSPSSPANSAAAR